jgi:hypothetical protein
LEKVPPIFHGGTIFQSTEKKAALTQTKNVEVELRKWRQQLQDAYASIRMD